MLSLLLQPPILLIPSYSCWRPCIPLHWKKPKTIRRKAPSDPTTCLPAFVARYAPLPWINFARFYLGQTPSFVYHIVWPPSTQSHRPSTLSPLPHCRFLPCTGLFPSAGQRFFFSNVKKQNKMPWPHSPSGYFSILISPLWKGGWNMPPYVLPSNSLLNPLPYPHLSDLCC